jgi:hypothetical protein
VKLGKLWNKYIKIEDARRLSSIFCKSFSIDYCEIYYVDKIKEAWGLYCREKPSHILMLDNLINPIGILMHELTHHLAEEKYEEYRDTYSHGYNYHLAKRRVIKWCNDNISSKPDWRLPLRASIIEKEMRAFRV